MTGWVFSNVKSLSTQINFGASSVKIVSVSFAKPDYNINIKIINFITFVVIEFDKCEARLSSDIPNSSILEVVL